MAQKRDWGKILKAVLSIPLVQDLVKQGVVSLSEVAKGGLPFRKKVREEMAVMQVEIATLREAVAHLVADKLEAEEAKSKSVKAVKVENEEAKDA